MTTKYQLKNGMNVLLIESHKSPVVAVQMWVKTGSADEEKGLEGISHFIEHLVFKGTKKYKVGEVAKAVETAGGDLNAYTSFDQTVFHVTLSKEFVDTGLDVVSQMMGFPTFDKIEIDNEREVVIEEIKRSQDNPHQQGSRLLFSTAYHEHPYRHPVLGFEKNIRDVTQEEIQKYFNARYVPQNMNLVIVGNFKTPEMKKKIVSYFGSFKKYPLKKVKRSVEPKQKQVRIAAKNIDFKECIMYLSWVTPKATHKDLAPLTLLAMILGQGDSSRLVQEIRNEKQLVNSIGSSLFSPKEPGFFAVSAALNPDKQKEVLNAVQSVLEKFLDSGPTQEEVNKSIQILESERYYSMETVDGLA
ncbi:MAG: pitrilysin family protein, partial [Bdellovibrionales bacterium]